MKTFGRIWNPVFGDLSDFAENELMDHIFNVAYPTGGTMYVGMGTGGDDTGLTGEPSGDNYAREIITFGAAATRKITQAALVTFNQASGSWGTMGYYGIFDAISGGNMLGWAQMNTPKPVVNGNTPSIANAEIEISIGAGEISDYLVHKLLDLMFNEVAFSKPATYIGFFVTALADDDAAAELNTKECADANAYLREIVNINGGASPTWKLATATTGIVENLHLIAFDTPTGGGWGVITAIGVCDALTRGTGNLLVYDNTPGGDGQEPLADDTVQIAADAFVVTMS